MPDTTAQDNWNLLRQIIEQDTIRYHAKSQRPGDYWDLKAFDFQSVLDSMDTLEHGLAFTQAKITARYDAIDAAAVASR